MSPFEIEKLKVPSAAEVVLSISPLPCTRLIGTLGNLQSIPLVLVGSNFTVPKMDTAVSSIIDKELVRTCLRDTIW